MSGDMNIVGPAGGHANRVSDSVSLTDLRMRRVFSALIEDPAQGFKEPVEEGSPQPRVKLTESAIGLIEAIPELGMYFLKDILDSGELRNGVVINAQRPAASAEFARTLGAYDTIALFLKAMECDSALVEAHKIFNQNMSEEQNPCTLEQFKSQVESLHKTLQKNPQALEALTVSIMMSDLGKSELFRHALREKGLEYIDIDHDVVMQHALERFNDEQLGELIPSFGALSLESRLLIRTMFLIEVNPGWVLQGETAKGHIESFLHPRSAVESSYLAERYQEAFLQHGLQTESLPQLAKDLLRNGIFISDISGGRRNDTPTIGTGMANKPFFTNYQETFAVLDSEELTVDDAFMRVVKGQAVRAGIVAEDQELDNKSFTLTRLAQLLRFNQHGIETELLESVFDSATLELQETLLRNIGTSDGRCSFTITYLPGIMERIMVHARGGDPIQKRMATKTCLNKLAEMYEALEETVGETRTGSHLVHGFPLFVSVNDRNNTPDLYSACKALMDFRIEPTLPEHPEGTINLVR